MSLPADLALVPVTIRTFVDRAGNIMAGKRITATLDTEVSVGLTTIVPKRLTITLDDEGKVPVGTTLPSTNDPDLNITGLAYTIEEKWPGGRKGLLTVAYDAASVDLADLVDTVAPPSDTAAQSAAQAAAASATSADASATAADASADAAAASEAAAGASEANAATSASTASTGASTATTGATTATTKATAATASATAASASQTAAASSATIAGNARTAAETARDAAQLSGGVYATITAGLAATLDNRYFSVPSSDSMQYLILYRRDNSTTATEIQRYPSVAAVSALPDAMDAAGLREYTGSGPIRPLFCDDDNNLILGVDEDAGLLVGLPMAGAVDFPIPAAVNHLLLYGQSLSVGATATTILSTAQPYSNITFAGGPRASIGTYASFKPLVEDAVSPAPDGGTNRGETPCSGAANYATRLAALENGVLPADHVILASAAGHGSYSITQLDAASAWYSVLEAHVSGAVALNPDYACHAVAWIQGENDTLSGATMDFATYRGKLEALQADIDATVKIISGQRSPVWMLTYQTSARIAQWADVALAQLDLCQKNDRFALTTPIYHMPVTVGDGVHLTNVGYKWLGAYIGRAYKQLVHDQRKPDWLNPVSATRVGTEIRVRFDVPVAPLVLDTSTLAATTNHGFKVVDSVGPVTISSVTIDGDEVVLALAATPSGATVVRYALDYLGTGLIIDHGASGNLRDSTPETVVIDGVARPMYHVCPHFQLTVVAHQEI